MRQLRVCIAKGKDMTGTIRDLARRVPGVVRSVRAMRCWRDGASSKMSRFIEGRLDTEYWRLHRFDALSGPYALGSHQNESYVVSASDRMIGRKLYSRGTFDLQKLLHTFEILRAESPGVTIDGLFDVGAHVGSICIPALKRGMVKRAMAFEPDPGNFRLLRINSLLNGVEDRLDCHEVALGEADGTAMLTFNAENHGDHRIVAATEHGADSHEVPVRKLDSFIATCDGTWLVWLDVQGFEPDVLAGATRALARRWPVVMEFTPGDLMARGTLDALLALMARSGYMRFFDLDDPRGSPAEAPLGSLGQLGEGLLARQAFTDLLFVAGASPVTRMTY